MKLQVCNLVKHFDGFQAVKGVSFDIGVGECVALIGPNGAGKSTTFACVAGQQSVTAGEILWAGQRIDGLTPAQRLARGIARTFQVAQTFEALTVRQNVQLILQAPLGISAWSVLDGLQRDSADALLARVGLQEVADADVLTLPYGAKKRLELTLALAGLQSAHCADGARLLLLDEPTAGLAEAERSALMQLVKSLVREQSGNRRNGVGLSRLALLYTEHNMDAVFGIADRVLVLIDGALATQGTPQQIAQNQQVRSRYLGRSGHGILTDNIERAQSR